MPGSTSASAVWRLRYGRQLRGGGRGQQTRTFGTTTRQVLELRDWLVEEAVDVAAMEATSEYWKPVFYLLEDAMQTWLLNAHHLKAVPGRKTDVKDSEWIAQLVEHGLVQPSFVPPPPTRELRDLTRYRKTIVEERTREIQRLEKHAFAERWVLTVRTECLDWILIRSRRHLERVLRVLR